MSKEKKKHNIIIWQLPVSHKNCFRPVNYKAVDLRDYVWVYQFEVELDCNIKDYLEELFGRFNINEPDDYYARSMSTSDLIMDKVDNKVETWVVDIVGFKKVHATGYKGV